MRDLTDSDQDQAVLDVASALADGRLTAGHAAAGHGPGVAAEAAAAARSRRRLGALSRPIHLTVVWARYGETGRMVPRAAHPHGEDFVRAKVRQLDWLADGLRGVTWSIIACDDGCPDRPSSGDLMTAIAAAEGYPAEGHRSVTVLTGEAAGLLALLRTLDLDGYVTLIEHLRAQDPGDPSLFGRRWPLRHLRGILRS